MLLRVVNDELLVLTGNEKFRITFVKREIDFTLNKRFLFFEIRNSIIKDEYRYFFEFFKIRVGEKVG